jgi:hypothetical protein
MISLYPLLVSNTISKNVVPGVCKVLENYIMVYGLSRLLDTLRRDQGHSGRYQIRSNKLIKIENIEESLEQFLYHEILSEAPRSRIYGQTGSGNKAHQATVNPAGAAARSSRSDRTKERREKERNKMEKEKLALARAKDQRDAERHALDMAPDTGKDSSVRLDMFNSESISLEPTWMKVDQFDANGNKMSGVIGVKVVPYAVKSDAQLGQLLMYDKQVKGMQRMAILMGRRMTSTLYNIWMKAWTKLPFTGRSTTVTGDPRKDILLKRNIISSGGAQEIFVLANQAELSDNFYSSAGGMKSLQKMGWGSMVIADDVNRRVAFCMKELQGLCSIMPYTMLYQTFSQAKVYEDIEDAKRNASSIFKVKREKMSKIIGEGIATSKTEKFGSENLPMFEQNFINEITIIDEGLGGFIKSMNPAKLKNIFNNLLMGKSQGVPNISSENLIKYAYKIDPNFKKGQDFARRVIENSTPDVSPRMANFGAAVMSIKASLSGGNDYNGSLKESLKQLMRLFTKLKSNTPSDKPKMPTSHYMDAVFGWSAILTMLAGAVAAGPIFQGAGNVLLKFLSSSVKFFEGFKKEEVARSVEEIVRNSKPAVSQFMDEHAPMIVLVLVAIAVFWKYMRNDK